MERNSSKEYSVVFLLKGKNFKLQNLPLRNSSLFSVLLQTQIGTMLEFAAFGRSPLPMPNIAELVPSVFSVHNHGFCSGPNTFSQEKHQHVRVHSVLSWEKE